MGYLRLRWVHSDRVPIQAMTKEQRLQRKAGLALAIAQGRSVALWARDNDLPRSTAYRWACQPEVRASAESCRRRAQDRAVGRMAIRTVLGVLPGRHARERCRIGVCQAPGAAVGPLQCECHVQVAGPEAPPGRDQRGTP
jgi:hypothetical protein